MGSLASRFEWANEKKDGDSMPLEDKSVSFLARHKSSKPRSETLKRHGQDNAAGQEDPMQSWQEQEQE